MTELERLASEMFERFGMSRYNSKPNWNYLSKERQIEWCKEVVVYHSHIIEQLEKSIKPSPKPLPGDASYSLGLKDGLNIKHFEILSSLKRLDDNLKKQLDSIINPQN